MLWKKWLKDYLTFGRRDRIGILALMVLIGIIYLLPRFFEKDEPFPLKSSPVLARALDTLERRQQESEDGSLESGYRSQDLRYEPSERKDFRSGELFAFDPNTLGEAGWLKLGLSERTVKTIIKYRNKGGKFYKAEDLEKIWGLPHGFYERVKDYIAINSTEKHRNGDEERKAYVKPEKKLLLVSVNEADTAAFIRLPGIGSKLAARIVGFREKLGGFYAIDQLRETYGLQDSVFQKIRPFLQLKGDVKKLNVNTSTKEELKVHPYFKWTLANAIVEYRNQHGSFKTLEVLKNIAAIDEATYGKIVNYLSL